MVAKVTSPKMGPFPLGVDNRRPDHAMYEVETRTPLLRSAVNVDVTNAGTLRRRAGTTKVLPGADCHSLYVKGERGYFVDFDTLKTFSGPASALVVATLRTGLTPGRRMCFADAPEGGVYYSNGIVLGRIMGTALLPLGAPAVDPVPDVLATPGLGSLPAGRYQITFAHVSADGEVGPASIVQQTELMAPGRITVSNIHAFPAGCGLQVFMTATNGDVLMRIATLTSPSALNISVMPVFGARCFTQDKAAMPPGTIVRSYNGRLLTASGSALYYSDAYAPALHTPSKGYIPFPAEITVVEPVNNGVYVVADQSYWLPGDIATAEVNPVLPYGALAHSSGQIPNSNSCWWMSTRGIVRADQNGGVVNLQEKHIATAPAASGAGAFIERDGLKQIVSPMFNAGSSGAAVSSWMDAEIVRKGTPL